MHLGIVLGMQGRHDESVFHLRAAVESDPRHAGAHHNLGLALLAQGLAAEGVVHLRAATGGYGEERISSADPGSRP